MYEKIKNDIIIEIKIKVLKWILKETKMFNMFNYLQLKGFETSDLVRHFEKIDEINENINKVLTENPRATLKYIKISYLDEEKKKIHFDIDIEVASN